MEKRKVCGPSSRSPVFKDQGDEEEPMRQLDNQEMVVCWGQIFEEGGGNQQCVLWSRGSRVGTPGE